MSNLPAPLSFPAGKPRPSRTGVIALPFEPVEKSPRLRVIEGSAPQWRDGRPYSSAAPREERVAFLRVGRVEIVLAYSDRSDPQRHPTENSPN